ncbi:sigma-54-dependent transcriptional regulator [Qipengyuania sp. MTN3-11]|uniref:sigma-54-dependent transcriptional regulator n=1 Tax=Qipengyuania sp. MTN3-11 TaxID=3056557 RepID=UPI0036F40EED
MSGRVLLVEDDVGIATVIREALQDEKFEVVACDSIKTRDALLARERFDVMLTDVVLTDGDGLETIAAVRDAAPDMPVIVLSAQNTLDTAVRASDTEAYEYFPKPFDLDELARAVLQATSSRAGPSEEVQEDGDGLPFIGRSMAMQGVYRMITRVLRNDLTVLVTGESGTGKELVAEAIHQLGSRKTGPLIAVNAAAIPRDLVESELFGHEKGAFTGAVSQAIGKFEQAHGGTLFLDEIGDMPAEAQTRLLRALQTGKIRRIGGRQEIAVDVRIIAATNHALEPLIANGSFREDLYYRLAVVPIHLPPLRDRKEDIGALAHHFLEEAQRVGLPRHTIDRAAIEALARHRWPGNVRELRNVIFRLALVARADAISARTAETMLEGDPRPETVASQDGFERALREWLEGRSVSQGSLYQEASAAFEKPLFEHALRSTDGNQLRAAHLLGINRNTLRKRLGELEINPGDFTSRG